MALLYSFLGRYLSERQVTTLAKTCEAGEVANGRQSLATNWHVDVEEQMEQDGTRPLRDEICTTCPDHLRHGPTNLPPESLLKRSSG